MTTRLMTFLLGIALCSSVYAQNCNDRINATTPIDRFVLNEDDTVTDSRSNLQWQRCPVGFDLDDNGTPSALSDDQCTPVGTAIVNWQEALQSAADLNAGGGSGGFADWRVPSLKELHSIVEFKCFGPAINAALFPDTVGELFWSSTTTNRIGTALVLDFRNGSNTFSYMDISGFRHYVRLVRGGN